METIDFKELINQRGLPTILGKHGVKSLNIGDELVLEIYFNPEPFNFFPSVVLRLNNDTEHEVFNFGNSFSYRFYYENVTEENVEQALNDAENCVNELENFASRFSIDDMNQKQFQQKVSNIFERNKFYYE